MPPRPATDAIESRMQSVRTGLAYDVDRVVSGAREVTDWKSQLRKHPVPAAVAAGLLGYMLVPSRPVVVRPDDRQMAKLAKNQQVVVTDKQLKKTQKGASATVMTLLGGLAARAATAYVTQQAGQILGRQAARGPQ